MPDTIIDVRGLSKQYERGLEQHTSFGQILANAFRFGSRADKVDPARAAAQTFWALRDVTFAVERGERIGIIGRNGAGKSTLLKILSRIVFPTEGEARLRGRVTSLLEVGTGFNMDLSGRENIYLNASLHGLTRRETGKVFDEIVEFSGIGEFLDTAVKRYSSGMFMRLAFSIAAHLDPDILMLDEVLAVGDLGFQQKCLQRVENLTAAGRTVLFVSHSMEAIARFCDRAIWLEHGRIVLDGPAVNVMEAYVSDVLGVISSKKWRVPSVAPPSPITAEALGGIRPDQDSETARDYPAAASLQAPERDVPAPGSDMARLLAVRVINRRKETTSALAIDEPVGIEVTYEILREGKNIQPALHFKTPADTYVFVAAFTDPEFMRKTTRVGEYVTIAWIPPQLLNTGLMYVTVGLNTPEPLERHCVADRVISFQVYERFEKLEGTARGLYAREFPGLVRPRLTWETHFSSGREPSPTTPTPLGAS